MWALAEVLCERQPGVSSRLSATIEDTSSSGACIRVGTPISVGTRLTVKWQWDQFSAIARNCRSDGGDFLCGVQRDDASADLTSGPPSTAAADSAKDALVRITLPAVNESAPTEKTLLGPAPAHADEKPEAAVQESRDPSPSSEDQSQDAEPNSIGKTQSLPFRQEKEAMSTKDFFSKFCRSQESGAATQTIQAVEPALPKVAEPASPSAADSTGELLSSEDIYRASGILHAHARYGIMKIVEMLESKHIRELPTEVKRASVLMALEAAGTSVDEVLHDAARRQHALNAYESGQKQQFEEFEAHKVRENAHIQAELERVVAHYSDRIRLNQEQVEREKEALRSWQAMKEKESQRISEAMALCGKQTAVQPAKENGTAPFPTVQPKSASAGKA
jgi:hypothetical protein